MKPVSALFGVAALALAGCGAKSALVPPEGQALPPAPYGASEQPNAQQLMAPRTATRPRRSDDILTDSHEREDDPFDLPPTD
ncbi:hypothetical protein KY084_14065 [Stakelama sp. CBK3Z-3]|uniref:Argininosuccinate lyase n=1 Tax=Stakelama flava TaxID=2860338 RepID=A0ABS6XQD3_9SPHN|nr:hypothetical protein [Stakelama flava]MBW4331993.1 hypothetical protein [Stakelama flava]